MRTILLIALDEVIELAAGELTRVKAQHGNRSIFGGLMDGRVPVGFIMPNRNLPVYQFFWRVHASYE